MADQVFVVLYRDMDESELRGIERLLRDVEVPPDEVMACTAEQVRAVRLAMNL